MSKTASITTRQITSSYGIASYSVRVSSMELYNSITLDVTFLDSENNVKDYRKITLTGEDYTNWSYDVTTNNDNYIMNKVAEICGFTMKSITGWATRIGGSSDEEGLETVTDNFGNVYVYGSCFTNPTVFNNFVSGGTGGAVNLSLYGNLNTGGNDLAGFIVKYNSSGSIQWVTKLIGMSFGTISGENFGSIAIDGDGNLYVCGYYGDSLIRNIEIHSATGTVTSQTINTTVYGTLPITAGVLGNGFLIKYNTNGVAQWATRISSTASSAVIMPRGVSVDSNGNVYLVGRHRYGITVESYSSPPVLAGTITTSIYGTLTTTAYDGFLIKYNTNGVAQWATRLGGSSNEITSSVAVDPTGNIYVLGSSASASTSIQSFSSVAANGGPITTSIYGTISRTADAWKTIVIAKYNTSGTALWATKIDGLFDTDIEYSIKVDNNGNLFVAGGSGSNPIRFYNFSSGVLGGAITTELWGTLENTQSRSAFLVKYNTSGSVQWALRQYGSAFGEDSSRKLALDPFGNVYMTGLYSSSPLTVNSYGSGGGGGSAVTLSAYGTLPNTGGQDIYVIKYNTSGKAQWATSMTGISGDERALAIAADSEGVYVSGSFTSSTFVINGFTSGGTGGQIALAQYGTLANSGSTETFVVKYKLDGKLV